MTKNSRLLFFVVNPCKELTQMNTKKTLIYNLNRCGSLEAINTKEGILYRKLQLRNPKEDSKTQRKLWTAEGYRHKENTKFVVDH